MPALFQEDRWGVDRNACEAPTDYAPGLVVWTSDGVIAEGTQMRVVRVIAGGKNFLRATMTAGPGRAGEHSFTVMGQKRLNWDDRSGGARVKRVYIRCGLAEGEERPSPPTLMQSHRWGTGETACRDTDGDGAGLVVFDDAGVTIEGVRAEMGRAKAQGRNFLRADFHFRSDSGMITTRDLRFAVIGGSRLDYGEYVENRLQSLGRYMRCP